MTDEFERTGNRLVVAWDTGNRPGRLWKTEKASVRIPEIRAEQKRGIPTVEHYMQTGDAISHKVRQTAETTHT
jgi:hypothetical protein